MVSNVVLNVYVKSIFTCDDRNIEIKNKLNYSFKNNFCKSVLKATFVIRGHFFSIKLF